MPREATRVIRTCPNLHRVQNWWEYCMTCGGKIVVEEIPIPMCLCGSQKIGTFCVYCGRKN